ncbi:MAG TPA: 3-phosphoserine/phosphohydroxythreonine transaminase [Burkholderiales bacterium]|nr:3-phosphoserine/phosphohydroxythreonine transaminase [Betaproteobacteria bacterium]HQR53218.1 3-phosphoserine/phosphohydroxythreonine transaminase [Burkholderiales bacterium]
MTERAYNFGPGPAMLPTEVLTQVQEELLDWHGCGASIMELSHRGAEFTGVFQQAERDLRELLAIPETHKVLFLQGGAATQFAAVPMNLLGGRAGADYVNTGEWSSRAIREARKLCEVSVVASSEAEGFTFAPKQRDWQLNPGAAYAHYCPNETVHGVEFQWTPETGEVPLVADMSSNILSRPLNVARYGLIYAGAQKNIAPAGLTLVIVRADLLGRALPMTPSTLDYAVQAEHGSMFNTPATFPIYVAGLVFRWLLQRGGLAAVERENVAKAKLLYDCIDASGFYRNPVAREDRSRMNVPFTLHDPKLDRDFLDESRQRGLIALKGHRIVGGMRASLYNAMPLAGVQALVDFMRDFESRHG